MKLSFFAVHPKKCVARLLAMIVLISVCGVFVVVVFTEAFNCTSSSSAIYVLKKGGFIELRRDLFVEDRERLLFMVNANDLFDKFMRAVSVVRNRPMLELTWDENEGIGNIKQYRPDGTMFSLSFSRFTEDGMQPRGLFVGGNLPYGDPARSPDWNTSGFGYYNGKEWIHIWCALNESFKVYGTESTISPFYWKYLGSRVLRDTQDSVVIETTHETDAGGIPVKMVRRVALRAGDDYFVLLIRIINPGPFSIIYGYSVGDEPWVGSYGTSKGDVGWHEGGIVEREQFISPAASRYAGYWDIGNRAAAEKGVYSGYANFVEWIEPLPTFVFFSNSLDRCCSEQAPLASKDNRILNIFWVEQMLRPLESRDHILAFGMARFNHVSLSLEKPDVVLDESLK